MKLVKVNVFTPLFDKRGRSHAQYVNCAISDACQAHKDGRCAGASCPSSSVRNFQGWTKRARKYRTFIDEHEAVKKDVPATRNPVSFDLCGEHYYLRYPHLNLSRETGKPGPTSLFGGNLEFIHKDNITAEWVVAIFNHYPRAILENLPIRAWMDKERPKMLGDIKRNLPDVFRAAVAIEPKIENYVDDNAPVESLTIQARELMDGRRVDAAWNGIDGKFIPYDSMYRSLPPRFEYETEIHEHKAIIKVTLEDDSELTITDADAILRVMKKRKEDGGGEE